jgi:hypothetical protein
MALAHKIRHLREAGMSEPDEQGTQPADREDWRTRRTMIEHSVIAARGLSWTEKGVYMALESHCYAGKNVCWPAVPTLADHTGLAARVVTRAVVSLERKGWLSRQVGGGTQTTRYFLHGNPGTPPDNLSPLPPDQDAGEPCQSVTTPLTICHHPPDKSSPEAVQGKQSKGSSPRRDPTAVAVGHAAAGATHGTEAQEATPAYRVFAVYCALIDTDPGLMGRGKKSRMIGEATTALEGVARVYQREGIAGDVEADVIGCLRFTATKPQFSSDQTPLRIAYAAEDILAWRSRGKPTTYRQGGQRASPASSASLAPAQWHQPVVCMCGRPEGRKHIPEICHLGGQVRPDWYKPAEQQEPDR